MFNCTEKILYVVPDKVKEIVSFFTKDIVEAQNILNELYKNSFPINGSKDYGFGWRSSENLEDIISTLNINDDYKKSLANTLFYYHQVTVESVDY